MKRKARKTIMSDSEGNLFKVGDILISKQYRIFKPEVLKYNRVHAKTINMSQIALNKSDLVKKE